MIDELARAAATSTTPTTRGASPTTAAGWTAGARSASGAGCASSGSRPGHIAAALGDVDAEEELDAAVALLERRFPVAPETRRDRDRALGMLVRKGYDLELATDALRRHAGAASSTDRPRDSREADSAPRAAGCGDHRP